MTHDDDDDVDGGSVYNFVIGFWALMNWVM